MLLIVFKNILLNNVCICACVYMWVLAYSSVFVCVASVDIYLCELWWWREEKHW